MPANLANHRNPGEGFLQLPAQLDAPLGDALDQPLAAQRFDHREADGAGERGPVPGVPQGQPPRAGGDRRGHMVPADQRSDGGVPGTEPLRRRDDVRHERQPLGGEPGAGAAHAGHDLVDADQEPVLVAALGKPLPEAVRRRVGGKGRRADRLAVEGRHRARAGLRERRVERREGLLTGRVEPPARGRDVEVIGEIGPERTVQPGAAGQSQGRHRRPVVGLGRGDHLPAIGLAALDVEAPRQPQGGLVRLGAAGDELDAREVAGGKGGQLGGQLLLRRVGEALVVDERHPSRLLARGGREVGPPEPQRGCHRSPAHRIQIPLTVRALEPDAVAGDDQRVAAIELERQDAGLTRRDDRRQLLRLAHRLPLLLSSGPSGDN